VGLDDFARALYGSTVFRSLCAWPQATVAVTLRVPDGRWTWRYDPRACAFVRDDHDDPIAAFTSGLEAWATDLAALLHGEIAPSALCYAGRMRAWNRAPGRLWISPFSWWRFAHPLRRPEAAARLYARILDEIADVGPRIRAR
jgi:hypothetical protein